MRIVVLVATYADKLSGSTNSHIGDELFPFSDEPFTANDAYSRLRQSRNMISNMKNAFIGCVLAAFVSGAFVASPELRAYAANTVGSIDIINNSTQSVDIKDGEVKTVDIGANAVTSAKIATSAVTETDLALNVVTSAKIKDGEVKSLDVLDHSITNNDVNLHFNVQTRTSGYSVPSGKVEYTETYCQSGEVLTGGGFVADQLTVVYSAPVGSPQSWLVGAYNPTSQDRPLYGYALCLTLPPT
jgi:hypothetical protein